MLGFISFGYFCIPIVNQDLNKKKCNSWKCPFGEMSVWRTVFSGNCRLGNYPFRKLLFGELSIGELFVGEMSSGNCPLEKWSSGKCPRIFMCVNVAMKFLICYLTIYSQRGKVKHKLRVQIYELRVQIHELRVQIHELRVQIHELRVQTHELRVQTHELRGSNPRVTS